MESQIVPLNFLRTFQAFKFVANISSSNVKNIINLVQQLLLLDLTHPYWRKKTSLEIVTSYKKMNNLEVKLLDRPVITIDYLQYNKPLKILYPNYTCNPIHNRQFFQSIVECKSSKMVYFTFYYRSTSLQSRYAFRLPAS